jgi:hypothetical protein
MRVSTPRVAMHLLVANSETPSQELAGRSRTGAERAESRYSVVAEALMRRDTERRTNAIVGCPSPTHSKLGNECRCVAFAARWTALSPALGPLAHKPRRSELARWRGALNCLSVRDNASVRDDRDLDSREAARTAVPPAFLKSALRSVALFAPVQFDLPAETELRLRGMHEFLNSSPGSIEHLRRRRGRDWLADMREQIFGAFREGLVAVHYHLARIGEIERSITEIAQAHSDELLLPGATIGLFSRPLNAEYQAFKFAVRRTLEYLAGAVTMYFKTDGNRIRKLGSTVDGRDPIERAQLIQTRLIEANLPAVIGAEDDKSVRDLLAHYRSVDAGAINIRADQTGHVSVQLVGGGEELEPFGDPSTASLSAILPYEVRWLEELAFGLFRDLGLLSET